MVLPPRCRHANMVWAVQAACHVATEMPRSGCSRHLLASCRQGLGCQAVAPGGLLPYCSSSSAASSTPLASQKLPRRLAPLARGPASAVGLRPELRAELRRRTGPTGRGSGRALASSTGSERRESRPLAACLPLAWCCPGRPLVCSEPPLLCDSPSCRHASMSQSDRWRRASGSFMWQTWLCCASCTAGADAGESMASRAAFRLMPAVLQVQALADLIDFWQASA